MKAIWRGIRSSPFITAGVLIVLILAAVALAAPWIAPYEPKAITGDALQSPSADHLLGTNDAGADIFSRVIWGSRPTLLVAATAPLLVVGIGALVGLTAGLRGGFADRAIMRVVDVFLALPVLPLLIFISALAKPSLTLAIVLIGVTVWPHTARLVRSEALSLRTRGFVHSARGFGAGTLYVMRRHLMPALGPVIATSVVVSAGIAVGIQAGLAFLGLGDPSEVSWGSEINRAMESPQIAIGSLWLSWLVPVSVVLAIALIGFTLIGVGLEPRFNPRWRRNR